jgi:hypothetical protein
MANKLDPMDLKQIITLHLDGVSNRKIGSTLGISRNTVNIYMKLFTASDYSFIELLCFDNAALSELFSSHTTVDVERQNELMLYFEGVNKARNHPGFTFLYHYQQYVQLAEDPYSYTQFLEHYRRKYAKEKGSMKLEHEAGKEMFIDFAGKKLHIVDKETGEIAIQLLMKSFMFKKALMQQHFNESYVESYKYPKAIFKGFIINLSLENKLKLQKKI